jgi:hypothetical protein
MISSATAWQIFEAARMQSDYKQNLVLLNNWTKCKLRQGSTFMKAPSSRFLSNTHWPIGHTVAQSAECFLQLEKRRLLVCSRVWAWIREAPMSSSDQRPQGQQPQVSLEPMEQIKRFLINFHFEKCGNFRQMWKFNVLYFNTFYFIRRYIIWINTNVFPEIKVI